MQRLEYRVCALNHPRLPLVANKHLDFFGLKLLLIFRLVCSCLLLSFWLAFLVFFVSFILDIRDVFNEGYKAAYNPPNKQLEFSSY